MLSEAGFGIWLICRARVNQLERLTTHVSAATPTTVIIGVAVSVILIMIGSSRESKADL
jgi:hypothetical protein